MQTNFQRSNRNCKMRSISACAIASATLASLPVRTAAETAPDARVLKDSTGAEAVIAPQYGGRVMSFTTVDAKRNLFWNAPAGAIDLNGWKNHGGEKSWIGPQNLWSAIKKGRSWPPPAHFDSASFKVRDTGEGGADSISMDSPFASGGDACPYGVHRSVSLENGTLRVVSRLVSAPEAPDPEAGLPAEENEWHVWSIAQVPWSAEVALRKTGLGRLNDGGSIERGVFAVRGAPAPESSVTTLAIDPDAVSGKLFFDGDAIAVGYPDGALVAHRIAGAGDTLDYPFPKHGRAQLYTGWHGKRDEGGEKYLELEFTAIGAQPLEMEFSFFPGATAAEALRRL